MNHSTRIASAVALSLLAFASCKKDDNNDSGPAVKEYTVPTTYSFSNLHITNSNQLVKMTVEVDAYLKTANTGSTVVALDQTQLNNLFSNTGNPFTNTGLNGLPFNILGVTENGQLYKSFADSVLIFNNGVTASQGVGGFVPRNANKIIVGPTGLEYSQAFVKGTMGALCFKRAVDLLNMVKLLPATDTLNAQLNWDGAFGYLGIPTNYDSSVTYASTDVNRPVLWGGYLAERGKEIQAGGTIFQAFLKGRAAIGGYDVATRNAQIDIILAKWEQLAAASALAYVTSPTASSSIGNPGTQFHALSEGFGFILSLQYRASNSKLSQADYQTLYNIIHKDFYALINQPGFTDLVTAQNILKNSYGL